MFRYLEEAVALVTISLALATAYLWGVLILRYWPLGTL